MPPNLSDHKQGLVLFSAANALVIKGRRLIDNTAAKRAEELKTGKAGCNDGGNCDDDEEDTEMQIMVSWVKI